MRGSSLTDFAACLLSLEELLESASILRLGLRRKDGLVVVLLFVGGKISGFGSRFCNSDVERIGTLVANKADKIPSSVRVLPVPGGPCNSVMASDLLLRMVKLFTTTLIALNCDAS